MSSPIHISVTNFVFSSNNMIKIPIIQLFMFVNMSHKALKVYDPEREKEYMKKHNQGVRDRRRIQFTMLTFLYAYKRELLLDMTRMQISKRRFRDTDVYNFYIIYNFISRNGNEYRPDDIAQFGKELISLYLKTFSNSKNSTLTKINSVNYFIIKVLKIDIERYGMKRIVKSFESMGTVPFIDMDMRLLLYEVFNIDYDLFYNNINNLLKRILENERSKNAVFTKNITISHQDIRSVILNSMLEVDVKIKTENDTNDQVKIKIEPES